VGRKPFGTQQGRQLGSQNLQCDVALVLEITGEVHAGHPPGPEPALEAVPVLQGRDYGGWKTGHRGAQS
jgi:hypothetical protein